jgi:alpha-beta hydrolase superfamily lysophospholipase
VRTLVTKTGFKASTFCLTVLTVAVFISLKAHADLQSEEYARLMQHVLETQSETKTFTSFDGTRLSYTRFFGAHSLKQPLVFVPGRGETVYRYIELTKKFLDLGYGPVFVLDHRGQGFSQRPLNQQSHVHTNPAYVTNFDLYVKDLIYFLEYPVRKDLTLEGAHEKIPFVIGHSLGGAILNLALLKRPDLVSRVAYISPMFGINTHIAALNAFNDRPARLLAEFLCVIGCDHVQVGASSDLNVVNINERRNFAHQMEVNSDIAMVGSYIAWVREAMRATDAVLAGASKQTTSSIITNARHRYGAVAGGFNCTVF